MLSRLNVVRLKMIRFRPLSGSYISQWNVKSIIKFYIIQSFRPLSGSYISQLALDNGTRLVCSDCFRPLSGSYISQQNAVQVGSLDSTVSVPYRGATFLNTEYKNTRKHPLGFPSPIGELHFSIGCIFNWCRRINCFRPLSGSYISQQS